MKITIGRLKRVIKEATRSKKPKKEQPWDKIFPDSESGAREAMMVLSSFKKSDIMKAKVESDPHVEGVWVFYNVTGNPEIPDAILYLKGYKESSGRVRTMNDFEDGKVRGLRNW